MPASSSRMRSSEIRECESLGAGAPQSDMLISDFLRAIGRRLTRRAARSCLFGMLCAVVVLSSVRRVRGWSSPNDSSRPVSLYVSILDKEGKPVGTVVDKDLSVLEEDKPRVITKLQFEKDTPVSLGVLIDVSRGVGPEGISLALSWLKTLAETL